MVAKQDLNIYTVMLMAAFLALLIGCIALALEMSRYDSATPWRASGARAAMVSPIQTTPALVPTLVNRDLV